MKSLLKLIVDKEEFLPSNLLGIWINPFFIVRKALIKGVLEISKHLNRGKLLDIGCGKKPYEEMFDVDEYIGIDIEISGHDHSSSNIDIFYDGKVIPFANETFDCAFCSEVFEHVFNLDELLNEINRVLKPGGKLGFTCPFVWDLHEKPYDFARYTPFAIEHLLKKHGFKLIKLQKSTGYIETVMQMFSAYVYQYLLPRNKYQKLLLSIFFVAPINIIGVIFGAVLPKNGNFYHNNIVIAEKNI
jgi:ubiquinone/menaquinone biosynthesis C-methylase UbiE